MSAVAVTELHALNFRFLLLAQQAAKADIESAYRVFGLSEKVSEQIADMSIDQLTDLSKTNALLFQGRISDSLVAFSERAQSPALRAVLVEANSHPTFATA